MGETDFANILQQHKGGMNENYVRVYWQQMLECVNAIHQCKHTPPCCLLYFLCATQRDSSVDVIHTDLKPANFIVVKGRLKLIDFGCVQRAREAAGTGSHRRLYLFVSCLF